MAMSGCRIQHQLHAQVTYVYLWAVSKTEYGIHIPNTCFSDAIAGSSLPYALSHGIFFYDNFHLRTNSRRLGDVRLFDSFCDDEKAEKEIN